MKYRNALTAITFLCVSFVTVLGAPTPAYGCSCADVSLHEYAEDVVLALVGQQTGRVVTDDIADGGATLTIEVDVVYKGEISAVVDLYTNAQDSACGEDFAQNGRVAIVAFSSQGRPTVISCSFVTEAELQQEFGDGYVPEPLSTDVATTEAEPTATVPSLPADKRFPGGAATWTYLGGAGLVLAAGGGLVGCRRLRPGASRDLGE